MTRRVTVGLLFSETGPTAVIERTQLQATLAAIKHANRQLAADGVELIGQHLDPQSDPALFATMSEQLILEYGVKVIFGCYTSASRKAVVPVVEKYNRLLFYPTLYEGFEFSPNVIYTGACPNQNITFLAEYMFSAFGSSCYLVGSDYVYPYESNRIMKDLVHGSGGQILGEHYVPLDAGPGGFRAICADIKACKPSFVFSTVVGQATRHMYEVYAETGLSPETVPIASLTTTEAELSTMRPSARAGHFTAAPFFASLLRGADDSRWGDLLAAADGMPVNQCWEASYFEVLLFAQAFADVGSDEPARLLQTLRGREIDMPQGRIRIDPENNHTWVFPRIGRSRADGCFDIVRESKQPVRPDPYLVSYAISAL
jgi:branched-chain amino acid transport system substrate-binding protein